MLVGVGISYDGDRIANRKPFVKGIPLIQGPGVAYDVTEVLSFYDFIYPNARSLGGLHSFSVAYFTAELSHGPILTSD